MANHGYVKTRKPISAHQITKLLKQLSQDRFQGNLKVDYNYSHDDQVKHSWDLSYTSPQDGNEYAQRSCWLNTSRSFEIKHGGGGDFAWWLDCLVTNLIALQYSGMISDDGVEGRWPGEPDKYPKFLDYANSLCQNHTTQQYVLAHRQMILELTPPEFQEELQQAWA